MQIFACTENPLVMRMVALEIDGPHTAFRAAKIQDAILIASHLQSAEKAMVVDLGKLLYGLKDEAAHAAGMHVKAWFCGPDRCFGHMASLTVLNVFSLP
jgi:hypothetical protein